MSKRLALSTFRYLLLATLVALATPLSCGGDEVAEDDAGTGPKCIPCTDDNADAVCPSVTKTTGGQTVTLKGCGFYTPCNRRCCLSFETPLRCK